MEKDNEINLEYTIIDRDSYGKEIDNIKEKNTLKRWTSLAPSDMIQFTLKFHTPSFVRRIETRGHESYHAELTFKDLDKEPVFTTSLNYMDKQPKSKNVSIGSLISQVDVKLTTDDGKSKTMGLCFLMFKGTTDMIKPSKEKHYNVSKQQTVKLETIQAPPIRSKPTGTSQPYSFLRKMQFEDRQKRIVKTKPQEQKRQFKSNQDIDIDTFSKEDSDTLVIEPQRDYEVARLGDLMDCLMYVNQEWLQAQRKMQEKMRVPEEQRLSNYIKAIQLASKP